MGLSSNFVGRAQPAYSGKLRNYGKMKKWLRTVCLPEGLANQLWLYESTNIKRTT